MDGDNEENLTSSLSTMAISESTAVSLTTSQSVSSSTSPTSAARSSTDHYEPLPPAGCKYVKTKGYRAVMQALEDEGRVLVCGSPGSGKTYMAKVLQEGYSNNNYDVICPTNMQEFSLEVYTEQNTKTLFVFDDIFGRFSLNTSELAHCFKVLDDIEDHFRRHQMQRKAEENVFRVLLSSRTDIYLELKPRLKRYTHLLLRPLCIIQLSFAELGLSEKERKMILKQHLQHKKRTLSEKEIEAISSQTYNIVGFPYICEMFVNRKTTSIKPVQFFHNAIEYLDAEISRMFHEHENYNQTIKAAVLLLLILTDGSFNLADLTNIQPNANADLLQNLNKLCQILHRLPRRIESLQNELNKAARNMIGTYVICRNDVVMFSHQTVYDVVAYAVGEFNQNFVLSNCSLQFIVERIVMKESISLSHGNVYKKAIEIGESYINSLLRRLISEMVNGKIALSLSHQALLHKTILEQLVDELKVQGYLRNVIHAKDISTEGLSFLFWACYTGVWKKGFLTVLGNPQFEEDEYMEAYLAACISSNTDAFQELLKKVGNIDGKLTHATVCDIVDNEQKMLTLKKGHRQDTMVVSKRHDRNFDHLIHIASANGHKDIVGLLLDMGIDINDAGGMGMTPIMYGSYFGHYDLVKMFLMRGVDTGMMNEDNDNCLHLAVRGGFTDIVKLLLKDMDPDCQGRYDRTPLMYAAYDGHREVVELLINYGACLQPEKVTEVNRNNSLHEACAAGQQDIVELLVQTHQMDIEQIGYQGKTPLLAACRGGRLETVKYLIFKNAAKDARDYKGNNCVLLAAVSGDVDTVQWLLVEAGFDIESQNYTGQTPLMCSVSTGNIKVFKFLLERGANADARDKSTQTCMHYGAVGRSLEIVKDLTGLGLAIDERGLMGRTPIMTSCMFGCAGVFNFLKECNARLTLKDEKQANCLHLACRGASIKIVQDLLEMNIFDIEEKDIYGNPALQMCVRKDSLDIMDILLQYGAKLEPTFLLSAARYGCEEATEKLLNLGLSVDFRGRNQMTPLMVACTNGNINISKQLLSVRLSQIHDKDDRGYTPLHFASAADSIVLLKYLVSSGANEGELTNDGKTVLHVASFERAVKSVLFFIKMGANVNIRENTQKTPLMSAMAQTKSNTEVVKVLIKSGSDIHAVSSCGDSLLHVAAETGAHTDTVQELITSTNIDINPQNDAGNTPIMVAALHGKETLFRLFLSRGATLTSRNKDGETILNLAYRSETFNMKIIKGFLRNRLIPISREIQRETSDMCTVLEYVYFGILLAVLVFMHINIIN